MAEWLCSGLQIRGPRFDSGRRLHSLCNATLAQLVERNLAKVEVTSSNLVCRSKLKITAIAVITDGVLLFSNRHRKKLRALVVELVDTRDLKSLGVRAVPVQVRPGAPSISLLK